MFDNVRYADLCAEERERERRVLARELPSTQQGEDLIRGTYPSFRIWHEKLLRKCFNVASKTQLFSGERRPCWSSLLVKCRLDRT